MKEIINIKRLSNLIRREMTKTSKGLDASQNILVYIYDNKDHFIYLKEIERNFSIQKPTVSKIIDSMEAKKLLVRKTHKNDKRLKSVLLTKKGIELAIELKPKLKEVSDRLIEGISNQDLEIFNKVLEKMIETEETTSI